MVNKQSSSMLSSIAAQVLSSEAVGAITLADGSTLSFEEAARKLAASVLSQDETPGQAPTSEPELAEAPSPDVMRQAFINTILHHNPSCGAFRAGQIVDEILKRQVAFYSQMAEVELDTSSVQAAVIVQNLAGTIGALIEQGAMVINYMSDPERWRRTATRARNDLVQLGEMLG